jgi:hypothetical protein
LRLKNKPVSPKWIAGFFMVLGLFVLIWALYDSGRLKVPIGIAHNQMGDSISMKTTSAQSCKSNLHLLKGLQKRPSKQRQLHKFVDLFPDVSSTQNFNIILCDGSELVINSSNYSKYTILSKRQKTYYLTTQKNNKKSKPLQIKNIVQIE